MCCPVDMDFLVSVHHLSVRTSRKSSLCEIMERSVFGGMEERVGQQFTSFHEFRYSETPQDKHCSVFHIADSQTKLHVLDFQYLEQNWNYPLIAPPALSCIASI